MDYIYSVFTEYVNVDFSFIISSNCFLFFFFKMTGLKGRRLKMFLSLFFMTIYAMFLWAILEESGRKLLYSIPVSLLSWDYILKPLYKKWLSKTESETDDKMEKTKEPEAMYDEVEVKPEEVDDMYE